MPSSLEASGQGPSWLSESLRLGTGWPTRLPHRNRHLWFWGWLTLAAGEGADL